MIDIRDNRINTVFSGHVLRGKKIIRLKKLPIQSAYFSGLSSLSCLSFRSFNDGLHASRLPLVRGRNNLLRRRGFFFFDNRDTTLCWRWYCETEIIRSIHRDEKNLQLLNTRTSHFSVPETAPDGVFTRGDPGEISPPRVFLSFFFFYKYICFLILFKIPYF